MNKSTRLLRALRIPKKFDIKFAKRLLIIFVCVALAAAVTAGGLFAYRFLWGDKSARTPERSPISLADADFLSEGEDGEIFLTVRGGMSLSAPENTAPAFEEAANAGYKSVLLFLRETKDGMAVVLTDETADKATALEGAVGELTFSQIINSPIDSGANLDKYKSLRILTFEEALKICYNSGLDVIAEFDSLSDSCIADIVSVLKTNQLYPCCMLASQDGSALKKIHSLDTQIKLCYRVSELSGDFKVFLNRCEISTVMFEPELESVNGSKIAEFLKEGYEIICSSVNDKDTLKTMYRYGVRHFVTDCFLPDLPENETTFPIQQN